MKLKQRQSELLLTDRALAELADVSTATVYRAKKGKASRYSVMKRIASALKCEVGDIEEFHPALRKRVFREARKQGAPPEVLDQADQVFEVGIPPSRETLQREAYSLLKDTIAYLDRTGGETLVERAVEERRRG